MSVRHQLAAVGTHTLTTGRLLGSVAALVALAGVIIGTRTAMGHGDRKRGAVVALAAGLTGMAIGGVVLAVAKGGPGTGYGVVGGFAALGIGLIATGLGWLGLARSRRPA